MMSAATVFISTFYAFGVSRGCTIRGATAGKRRKHCLDVNHEILKHSFSIKRGDLMAKEIVFEATCA